MTNRDYARIALLWLFLSACYSYVAAWAPGSTALPYGFSVRPVSATAVGLFGPDGIEIQRWTSGASGGTAALRLVSGVVSTALPTLAGQTLATKGLYTAAGFGLGVGCPAPTTSAFDIMMSTISNPPPGTCRLQANTGALYVRKDSGNFGLESLSMSIQGPLRAASFTNYAGTGAPICTYGIALPAGAKPPAPAANSLLLYNALSSMTANGILSVERSNGTTYAYVYGVPSPATPAPWGALYVDVAGTELEQTAW